MTRTYNKDMGFGIPNLHIDESSPEGRVVREIGDREGVTPEEAVRVALRRDEKGKTSAEAMIGMFSSPEDAALIDEIMDDIRARREHELRRYVDR